MHRPYALLLAFLLCFLLSGQQVSPELFGALKWRLIGPFRGGRTVAVSGVRGGDSVFYFGAVDGGIWKSDDAGVVWTPLFDAQRVASIGALDVAPSNANIIYAGTGESDIRSDLATGDGVYKSIDSGQTWKNVGLRDTRQISRILVHPRNPNIVLVAALGHAYAPNEERGVFRSTDGGETWHKVLYRGPAVGAADLAAAADEPDILFAAMWEARRPPWSTYAPVAGPGSGLYRSKDGGKTWEQLSGNGLPAGEWGRVGVAVANGTHGKRIYAVIEAKEAGLYRSDDKGDHWSRVNTDPRIVSRAWYFNSITADPNDPDILYVPNVALYKLSDGGKTLSIVRGAPGGDDYHQLWLDPANSAHLVLGSDQGASVSLNGGRTWSSWYNQPTAQFYHVVTDNQFPYHVYGAQQDSGTAATASRTAHGEIDARDWFTVSGSESGYIAPDPKNSNIFYVSGTYGSVSRFDCRTMQSQNIAPWPLNGFSAEITERKYRDPWTPVLLFSPAEPNALYLGTQYVMRTVDGGLHWQTISPDLTGADAAIVAAKPHDAVSIENAKQRGYGVVYTIAPSPLRAAQLWAGTDTGLIHLTRDAGKTWRNVTPPDISPWSKITHIEASHFSPGEAYAAIDRHRLDDMRPYLYRTRDFGKSWVPIANGFAEHAFLNAVRADPKRKGLLFAGTEFGVYVSFDDGDNWQPLQLNLPVTSVRDLAIHDNDLIVATHGRAFWILDDIAPLRQIASGATARTLLYKPATAVRISSDAFSGTPLPPEEPQAENPARGAYLDYFLAAAAESPVQLAILDAQGRTVRRFSSADKLPGPAKELAIAPRWIREPQKLSQAAGMHRFVWDLRSGRPGEQTTADVEDTGIESWIGPLVLPGAYQVKLTVDGHSYVQPLRVTLDPRSRATATDLLEQFQWAERVFADMIEARRTGAEVRGLRIQLGKAQAGLPQTDSPLRRDLASADEQLHDLQSGGTRGSESGLDAIDQALTLALGSIESADRVPPSQLIDLYRQSTRLLKLAREQWSAFKLHNVPSLNEELHRAALPPLRIVRVEQASHATESQ